MIVKLYSIYGCRLFSLEFSVNSYAICNGLYDGLSYFGYRLGGFQLPQLPSFFVTFLVILEHWF